MLREEFCLSYRDNFLEFAGDLSCARLFVVDDYSPCFDENCKVLEKCGLPYEYWSIRSQIDFFRKNFDGRWERYWSIIPHRTDASRSFGYLVAARWGADVIITIDDDNYAVGKSTGLDYDYLGSHDVVNSEREIAEVHSTSRWFNPISMLMTKPDKDLYARGYPYSRRFGELNYHICKGRIAMNVGLWTGVPDVDSLSVLAEGSLNGLPKTRVLGFRSGLNRLAIGKGTLAPLNTANTAYSRKLLPIIYDTFQGAQIGELRLDRFGDIWCNLVVKKILDQTGDRICVGMPLVEHRREPRSTFDDFRKEFWGIVVSERVFDFIERLDLQSRSYGNLYQEIVESLRGEFLRQLDDLRCLHEYFGKLFASMLGWLDVVEQLGLA